MSAILLILIILICLVLSFFVLIQNPKGGGMAGTFGGFGNQVMGAKQSAEGVEKVTWWTMGALAAVVLISFVLMEKPMNSKVGSEVINPLKASSAPVQAPPTPAPAPANTAPAQQGAPANTAPATSAPANAAPATSAPASSTTPEPSASGEAPLPAPAGE